MSDTNTSVISHACEPVSQTLSEIPVIPAPRAWSSEKLWLNLICPPRGDKAVSSIPLPSGEDDSTPWLDRNALGIFQAL